MSLNGSLRKQGLLNYCIAIYNIPSFGLGVKVMVFNATFNNISVISWRFVLLVEETRVSEENQQQVTDKLY